MPPITRRRFVHTAAAAAGCAGLPVTAAESAPEVREDVVAVLRTYLEHRFLPDPLRCGARQGDGVPAYADVEGFIHHVSALVRQRSAAMSVWLRSATDADFARGRVMVIDGWVMARTEALAASAYVLLTSQDCALDTQKT